MKKMVAAMLISLCLAGCSKQKPPEGPYGLWKGMTRSDISLCCQVEKTAQVSKTSQVTRNASIMKLATVPRPDKLFRSYYVHFTPREGVFAVTSSTGPIPLMQAQDVFNQTLQSLIDQYGFPTPEAQNGDLIWDHPIADAGIFRITISLQPSSGNFVVILFYIFDNNRTYS